MGYDVQIVKPPKYGVGVGEYLFGFLSQLKYANSDYWTLRMEGLR